MSDIYANIGKSMDNWVRKYIDMNCVLNVRKGEGGTGDGILDD